jgi:hypothetical protein
MNDSPSTDEGTEDELDDLPIASEEADAVKGGMKVQSGGIKATNVGSDPDKGE